MSLQNMLDKIDKLQSEIKALPQLTECEKNRFDENFVVNYTYNSNAIEGNSMTQFETALIIMEGVTINKKSIREHLEIIGHKQAFDYVVEISRNRSPLTERTIKDIHTMVLVDQPTHRGVYRTANVIIGGANDIPPHALQVSQHMTDLLDAYALDTRHPIVRIADFHILFERVHPFSDGNGRTGRLIMNLELIKFGFQPIDVKYTDRTKYIQCFKDFEEKRNSNMFIEMVARYEIEELESLLDILVERKKVIEHRAALGEES
ncbi:MAG: Fic family protein [Defluviitaleaceae bacterium]|nr:Fic family protein [Defluviitaleaceae bacterium]